MTITLMLIAVMVLATMTFGGPSIPRPAPLPEPEPLGPTEKDLTELAQQRREIERRRRGRKSLVVDPSLSTPGGTGLNIPNP